MFCTALITEDANSLELVMAAGAVGSAGAVICAGAVAWVAVG